MAQNAKPVAQLDFSGGANTVVNPYLISQKQSADIQNLILDEHGALRTRDGVRTLTTSPDTTNPIVYRGILTRNNGQEFPFAIQTGDTGSAIALDTSLSTTKSGSSGTQAMTLGASATVLLVTLGIDDLAPATNSITYAGVALTKIGEKNVLDDRVELWGLLNPTTGSSQNIVVSLGGTPPSTWHLGAMSFTNTTGWGSPSTASGVGVTTASITIASASNHRVVAVYQQDVSVVDAVPNQTSIYQTNFSDNNRAEGQHAAGAASVAMTYTISSGARWTMVAVNLITGGNKLYRTDTVPWTDIGDLGPEPLPQVVYVSDKAVFFHGYNVPKTWDGTTLTNVVGGSGTAPAGAKHGVFHLGAVWIWNTALATSASDGPSSLEASATNDPNDWPAANQIFISKDDGQVGMGLCPFTIVETGIAPTATLVAFKNYSGYQITGVFGSSTFGIQPIKSDMGCIAPRTIQFVSGFGIIRLTHKGFALYNGVEDRLISEEMRPYVFGTHDISGLDFSSVERSWASQSQNPPLYIAACPVAGTNLTRIFVYDLIRRGWTICTLPEAISCMNLYFSRTTFPVVHAGTSTGGKLISIFNDELDDDGTGIAWSLLTRAFFAGNHMNPTFWRRANVSLNVEPNSTVVVTPILDNKELTPQSFSTSAVDDDPDAHTVDTVLSVELLRTAHTCQLLIEGENHCHIRGIEFQAVPKPSTRYQKRI